MKIFSIQTTTAVNEDNTEKNTTEEQNLAEEIQPREATYEEKTHYPPAEIGRTTTLEVLRMVDFGAYLDGLGLDDILLLRKHFPEGLKVGDMVEVFIYRDSEDRLISTTLKPMAQVGDFACLEVDQVTPVGAFLKWGLPKDLLVPFREQKMTMQVGREYVVFLYLDHKSDRIVATAKIDKHLSSETYIPYEEGDSVNIMIVEQTDLGFKAIVENEHWGLIFESDVFQDLEKGKRLKAYIKTIREDNKIDLVLRKPGYEAVDAFSGEILKKLELSGGFIALNDKSAPAEISMIFGVSKKVFKKAIGGLYRQRLITINPDGIRLAE